MTALENEIRKYAYIHECDMDMATYRVMIDQINEIQRNRSCKGLYDRFFKEASTSSLKERKNENR